MGGIELSQLSSDSLQGVIHSFGMRRKKRGYFRIGVAGQKQPEHLALVIGKLGLHPAVQFSAEFCGLHQRLRLDLLPGGMVLRNGVIIPQWLVPIGKGGASRRAHAVAGAGKGVGGEFPQAGMVMAHGAHHP